jgi:hypothetical protein
MFTDENGLGLVNPLVAQPTAQLPISLLAIRHGLMIVDPGLAI